MDDMTWELQLVAAMKSDDTKVSEPAWREFMIPYWGQLEEDMQKYLQNRQLPTSYAPQAATYALKAGYNYHTSIRAESLDGVYGYLRVIGKRWIDRNAKYLTRFPDEPDVEDNLLIKPLETAEWEMVEPYAQAMDCTYDALNRQHRELTALAWVDALDILATYMKEEYRNLVVLAWGKAFEYLITHPEVLGRDELHFDDIRDLRVRHIAAIYSLDPANLSQILWRARDTFRKCLERFL